MIHARSHHGIRYRVTDDEGHKPVPETSRVVEVVGVFDTVGSLGIPHSPYWGVHLAMRYFGWRMGSTKAGFHNVELSPCMSCIRQKAFQIRH